MMIEKRNYLNSLNFQKIDIIEYHYDENGVLIATAEERKKRKRRK